MDFRSAIKKRIHESNAEYHDFWADTHDKNVPYIVRKATRRYYWNLIESTIISSGHAIHNAEVLEIGCGTGTFTDIFISKGAKSFTGIDLSKRMIEKAKLKADKQRYTVPVHFYVDSLESFAVNNENKFDIIQSSSFIHHLSDIDEGIRFIKALLKPNGLYIAIHEEITDFKKTKLNQLDDQLQYLFGYGGSSLIDRSERIKQTMIFFIRPVKLFLKKLFGSKPLQQIKPDTNEKIALNEDQINYIDYQLNERFSLSLKCAQYGVVKPYCYFGFPELMIFGNPINFEMLIMKK